MVVLLSLFQAMVMSPDNRIGVQEKEPKSFIRVERLGNIRGGRSPGGRVADTQMMRTFSNPTEASAWITEDKGEHFHNVEIPFGEGTPILVKLEGPRNDQRLIVRVSERVSNVSRTVDGHHGAIAPGGRNWVSSLWIPITDIEEGIIDREVSWLSVNTERPILNFVFLPESRTREEVLDIFLRVNKRAYEVFQDIINGTVPEAN